MKKIFSFAIVTSILISFSSCTKKNNENEILLGSYSSNTGATGSFGVLQNKGSKWPLRKSTLKVALTEKKSN